MRRAAPDGGSAQGRSRLRPSRTSREDRTATCSRYRADRGCRRSPVAGLPSRQDLATVVERPRMGRAVGPGAGCAGSPPTSLHHVAGRHRCVPWLLSWGCLRSTFLPRSWMSGADPSLLGPVEALDSRGGGATVIVTVSPWRSAPDGAMPTTVPGAPPAGAVTMAKCFLGVVAC